MYKYVDKILIKRKCNTIHKFVNQLNVYNNYKNNLI